VIEIVREIGYLLKMKRLGRLEKWALRKVDGDND